MLIKERDSLGEKVGEVQCQQNREIYNKPTQLILSVIWHAAAENTNNLPYITRLLTTHFIFCTNEFIIRRDMPLVSQPWAEKE